MINKVLVAQRSCACQYYSYHPISAVEMDGWLVDSERISFPGWRINWSSIPISTVIAKQKCLSSARHLDEWIGCKLEHIAWTFCYTYRERERAVDLWSEDPLAAAGQSQQRNLSTGTKNGCGQSRRQVDRWCGGVLECEWKRKWQSRIHSYTRVHSSPSPLAFWVLRLADW